MGAEGGGGNRKLNLSMAAKICGIIFEGNE